MNPQKTSFDAMTDGTPVDLFTLTNAHGLTAKIITYGARLTELHVPNRAGEAGNIALGFDSLAKYLQPEPYFGPTIGRVANRIAYGQFALDGKTYELPKNDGPHTLHGGTFGFDKKIWKAEVINGPGATVQFSYVSQDMEEGFPGTVSATVTYMLDERDQLWIEYSAQTDKPTPINLTNHTYFNLKGAGRGDILDHVLMLAADRYTAVDEKLIPTGEIATVRGTPLDFMTPAVIGARIGQVPGGYDHNYVLNNPTSTLVLGARVSEPKSGRVMEVATTQPGIQFYTGNFLDGTITGNGGVYGKHSAFCLETQHFPDSVHHANFPSTILRPNQMYRQVARFRFFAE